MKKVLIIAGGLMSLLGMLLFSSCDDKSTFIEEEEFAPYGYVVSGVETVKIVGYKGLIIDDVGKSDWQLYVPFREDFIGNEALALTRNEFSITLEKNTEQIDIETNMEPIAGEDQEIPFALGGLTQPYTYMGEQVQLLCLSPLKVTVEIVQLEVSNDPYYYEEGHLDFSLVANDSICLLQKIVPYRVAPVEFYRDYVNN
jgi:hypothetical protein